LKNTELIGFWKRVLIYIIDFVIYFVSTGLIVIIINYFAKLINVPIKSNSDVEYAVFFIFQMLLPLIFIYYFWTLKGASIGMLIFKVRIVDVNTLAKPSNKKLLIRLLGAILSHFTFLLSFMHVVFDSRKQTWHDKLSNTTLVKHRNLNSNIQLASNSNYRDKKLIFIELVLFSIFMILAITFLVLIFHDQKLIPEAIEWMKKVEIVEENPMDNEFYFLVGFSCIKEINPSEYGYNWIDEENEELENRISNNNLLFNSDIIDPFKKDSLKIDLSTLYNNYKPIDSLNVTTFLNEKGNFVDSVFCSLDILFERYEKIGTFFYFQNTLIPHSFSNEPPFADLVLINRLKAYWVIKEYLSGNESRAINELNIMNTKVRHLMRISETQIEKMVSWYMFENNLKCLSLLIDASKEGDVLNVPISHLSNEEMNWDKIIKNRFKERVSNAQIVKNSINLNSEYAIQNFFIQLYLKWVFKFNKLSNSSYNYCLKLNEFSRLNGNDFTKFTGEFEDSEFNFIKYILEPTSYMLSSSDLSFEVSYLTHNHDINGYINMLKLKILIKNQNLTPEQIPAFLKAQQDSLFNPYTLEAIEWDIENSKLFFTGPYDYNDKDMRVMKIVFH
jgi:uncharacterized RDD family membrane protein YckC